MSPMLLLLTLAMTPSDTLTSSAMQRLVPASIREWQASEPARFYSGREIFRYMNGAGEVYLAYGFNRLLVQRYARPQQEEILVEVFDMGLPRNAFGAFTNMQGRGPAVAIGQSAEYKNGLLSFWRNRFFVCVMIDNENEEATKAVLDLGSRIAESIGEDGPTPPLLRVLPQEISEPQTLRYFFRHEILNIHFYVADKNTLRLNESTDALLVRLKSDRSHFLLIQYPSSEEAAAAYADFTEHYMPEAQGKGWVQTENKKWTVCRMHQKYVLVVFDAVSQTGAQTFLTTLERILP
jgi:hypothetical protein